MRRLAILALVGSLVTAAYGDTVKVQGTAAGFEIDPTPDLAKIGYALDPSGSFEFSFSYDSTQEFSVGSFKLVSKAANGAVLDTIDLNPTNVVVRQLDNIPEFGGFQDEYVAGVASSRAGNGFQILVDLVDGTGTMFPSSDPATYLNKPWPQMFIGIGIADPSCAPNFCEGFVANIVSMTATVTPVIVDSDGDGVPDSLDQCPGSSSGVVNSDGCTITQLVPCAGPKGGGNWKNHGQYISNVAKIAQQFLDAGLITEDEKDALIAAAANSGCGK